MNNQKKLVVLIILCNVLISIPTTIETASHYSRQRTAAPRTNRPSMRYAPCKSRLRACPRPCHVSRQIPITSCSDGQETWKHWYPMEQRIIDGRLYTKHAVERMAPDITSVRLELERRALALGYPYGSSEFIKYITPRGISPKTVERVIKKGKCIAGKRAMTKQYEYKGIRVITNQEGTVITVIRLT
ncbi:MAG TPA: hypothetical protein VGT41_02050 [Candidatus Babeliales bacterium]|nr:hypothetical protein [Candidatus Babeliales bacterium]